MAGDTQGGNGAIETSGCGAALVEDLGWGLGVLFRAYATAAHAAVADLPGGPRGYQVLSAAVRSTVDSQYALAVHLGIDRTVMTYLLDDLETAGLITRQPDPTDRRARRVLATAEGAELLNTLRERLRDAEEHLLAPLDSKARGTFRAQLQLLATRANAADPIENACALAGQMQSALTPRRTGGRATRRR